MTTLEYKPNPEHPERRLPPLKRKTQTLIQGKPLAVALHPDFLEIRKLGSRKPFSVTWRKIYEVAAKLAADKVREEKLAKRKNRKSSLFR